MLLVATAALSGLVILFLIEGRSAQASEQKAGIAQAGSVGA
jgi:hypothetical protein